MKEFFDWLVLHPDLANAFSALASTLIALLALFIAITSTFISIKSIKLQISHSKISIRPIPSMEVSAFNNKVSVRLRNGGLGPLICKTFDISEGDKIMQLDEWLDMIISKSKDVDVNGKFWVIGANHPINSGQVEALLEIEPALKAEFSDLELQLLNSIVKNATYRLTYTDLHGDTYVDHVETFAKFRE